MVGIAGHVASRSSLHLAGSMREIVPDGLALAVLLPSAFDLIGGSGGAPNKFVGKLEGGETGLGLQQFADQAVGGQTEKEAAAPTAAERNSRRLKLFHLLTDSLLDYGVRELEGDASARRPNSMSRRMRAAPTAIAESATLKAG